MNFSARQWVAVVVLDILLRSIFFAVTSFHIVLVPLALFVSLIHLALLSLTSFLAIPFERPPRITPAVTLVVTNIVFCVTIILLWVWFIKSGRVTACTGVAPTCSWIDGQITWYGVQEMARMALIQVVINMAPVLAVCGVGSICRKRAVSEPT
jgi:hypothetical protein